MAADWYDLGCARSCRYGHTRIHGQCVKAEPPPPELKLYTFEVHTAYDGSPSGRFRRVTVEEVYSLVAAYRGELSRYKCGASRLTYSGEDVRCIRQRRHSGDHEAMDGRTWFNMEDLGEEDDDDDDDKHTT